MCVCTMSLPGDHIGWKRVLKLLVLELQTVVSHHVFMSSGYGAGVRTGANSGPVCTLVCVSRLSRMGRVPGANSGHLGLLDILRSPFLRYKMKRVKFHFSSLRNTKERDYQPLTACFLPRSLRSTHLSVLSNFVCGVI